MAIITETAGKRWRWGTQSGLSTHFQMSSIGHAGLPGSFPWPPRALAPSPPRTLGPEPPTSPLPGESPFPNVLVTTRSSCSSSRWRSLYLSMQRTCRAPGWTSAPHAVPRHPVVPFPHPGQEPPHQRVPLAPPTPSTGGAQKQVPHGSLSSKPT